MDTTLPKAERRANPTPVACCLWAVIIIDSSTVYRRLLSMCALRWIARSSLCRAQKHLSNTAFSLAQTRSMASAAAGSAPPPLVPPFTAETAKLKARLSTLAFLTPRSRLSRQPYLTTCDDGGMLQQVQFAEDAWNSRDPDRCAKVHHSPFILPHLLTLLPAQNPLPEIPAVHRRTRRTPCGATATSSSPGARR